MALRPTDYSSSWLGLFELFESVHGKLHISIPDTAILIDGQIAGWFYTSRDGAVGRVGVQDASFEALFLRLTAMAVPSPDTEQVLPVAVAHYASGISRHLNVDQLSGLMDQVAQKDGESSELPFCIQAYVDPLHKKKFVATYGASNNDLAVCTVFARRYGSQANNPSAEEEAVMRSQPVDSSRAREDAVESQLIALGLLEPANPDGSEAVLYIPRKLKVEVQRVMQLISDFVEKAHGYRMQGLVAEFIHSTEDVLYLTSVLAVQWDTNFSGPAAGPSLSGVVGTAGNEKGGKVAMNGGNFNEQWSDFMTGMGVAAGRQSRPISTKRGPMLKSDGSPLYMTGRASSASRSVNTALAAHQKGIKPRPRTSSSDAGRSRELTPSLMRASYSASGGMNGSGYTARNAMSAVRRGAGGNPTASPPASSSFSLWTPQDLPVSECVLGAMALELERVKEALQKQTDITIRSETAINHLLASTQGNQQRLGAQVEELEDELVAVSSQRKESTTEYQRLVEEREQLEKELNEMQAEVHGLRQALDSDRVTLSQSVKVSQEKEAALEDEIRKLTVDNVKKGEQVASMQRRVEEESEVIDAVRSQLYDYRQMVSQLQSQLRRGKNKPVQGASSPSPSGPGTTVGATAKATDGISATVGRMLDDDASVNESIDGDTYGGGSPGAAGTRTTPSSGTSRFAGGQSGAQTQPVSKNGQGAPRPAYIEPTPELSSPMGIAAMDNALSDSMGKDPLTGSAKDFVAAQLTEMRRLRRFGPEPDQMGGMSMSLEAGPGGSKSPSAIPGGVAGTSQVLTHRGGSAAASAGKRREPWRPNYETVVLQDLFIAWGDMTDHMLQTQATVLSMLKELENEFLDVFKFYSALGGLHIYNDRQCMTEKQLIKMCLETGFMYEDQVEEVFKMMSERAAIHHDEYQSLNTIDYISFDLFPETICRLAAAKFEWRPPESNDEADEEVELPESLKKTLLLAREKAVSGQARKSTVGPLASFDLPSLTNEVIGVKTTDKILYLMIKTYVFIDLLPNARRTKTAGSVLSNAKSHVRSAPPTVWMK